MITMLERLSLQRAIGLKPGERITVTSFVNGLISEYEFVRYDGVTPDVRAPGGQVHRFAVRDRHGRIVVLNAGELGVVGARCLARLGSALGR